VHLAGLRALFWGLGDQEVQCVQSARGFQATFGRKLWQIKRRVWEPDGDQALGALAPGVRHP